MTKSIEERFEESFKYGGNSQYLDHLYEQYIEDPSKIKPEWKKYFDSIQNGQNDQSHKLIIEKFRNKKVTIKKPFPSTESSNSSDVQNLINAYRRRGHQIATIDPLDLRVKKEIPELGLSFHNLTPNDLTEKFALSNFLNSKEMQLKDILESVKSTYTSNIGYEFMHIGNSKIRKWFLERIEGKKTPYNFSQDEKSHILKRVVDSEGLEKFLASKYPGAKSG